MSLVFVNPTVLALPLELYSARGKQVRLETQFYEAPSSATITILDLPPRLCARSRAVRGFRSFRKELVGAVRLVGSCVRLSIPYTLTQDKDRVRTVRFAHREGRRNDSAGTLGPIFDSSEQIYITWTKVSSVFGMWLCSSRCVCRVVRVAPVALSWLRFRVASYVGGAFGFGEQNSGWPESIWYSN